MKIIDTNPGFESLKNFWDRNKETFSLMTPIMSK